MGVVKISPNFSRLSSALTFPSRTLNYLLEEQVYDSFEFYQSRYAPFGFMRITDDMQHKIHWIESLPFAWQSHNSCHITATGHLRTVEESVTPCRATAMSKLCYDELFGSVFKHLMQWDGRGPLSLKPLGNQLMQRLLNKILEAMVLGARMTLTAGQIYEYDDLVSNNLFKDGTKDTIKDLFKKTIGTCRGWLEMLKAKAQTEGNGHLNAPSILLAGEFDGKKFIGDVFTLVDRIYAVAPDDLMEVVDTGGIPSVNGVGAMPLLLFSTYIVKAVADQWRKQCDDPLCANPRLKMEMVNWRGREYKVYSIDGIVIIPQHDVNRVDKYLKSATHYVYLTVNRNIQLGASFTNIPNLDVPGMGMRIKMSDDNEDFGKTTTRADSLFSTVLSNTQFIAGQTLTIEPAA